VNGPHDYGGQHGWGPINPEAAEPPFHAEWETRALAVTLAMGATGQWNIDMSRAARESLPPLQYLSSSYYEIWIAALEKLMLQRGLVTREEILAGEVRDKALPLARRLAASDVATALARGTSSERPPHAPARFSVGQTVRMLNLHPRGHTRLPRYARGRSGRIVAVRGVHVFADSHALPPGEPGAGENPQWLYTVSFSGRELWGPEADASLEVSVDAWERYLEAATA